MLGTRIYEIRKNMGWSQVDLAKKLNITKQTISNWENDNIQPSIEMLIRLAKLFGVSTDYLLGLSDSAQLNVDGLSSEIVAHLALLIDDFRSARFEK